MQAEVSAKEEAAIDQLDPREYIIIKGAKVNNLKNLSVAIPRSKLIVITGLSGSGKSSLAFDTLFAEGQRKYVESLSSYARQFLGRMEKPEVDYIKGVSPAIAIEQKVSTKNPRSTVGTTTEIYDYLKLFFARIGVTYSPKSGGIVKKDSVSDVVDFVFSKEEKTKMTISCPLIIRHDRSLEQELNVLLGKGYTRIIVDTTVKSIEEALEDVGSLGKDIEILIDRISVADTEENRFRTGDSVQTAFFEGEGTCIVTVVGDGKKSFSDKFELDGIKFEEPTINLFTFNNPYGACRRCEGFGRILGIDPDLVIPDKNLTVHDGAIAPWRSETMSEWLKPLLRHGIEFDFPIHRPYNELDDAQKEILWTGNEYFEGLDAFFQHLESKTHKIQYRVMLSRYRGRTTCTDCKGTRLRKDANYVKIGDKCISDLVLMPIDKVGTFFDGLKLSKHDREVSKRIMIEITSRLDYLMRVGLSYLTLNRVTSTLSGGEYQRIKLATSLGSSLVGSMYILDEPSIGLHPRDTKRLIGVLENLRDLGNTVIVVEHEEEVMHAADQIIDIGYGAGTHGGSLVFQGDWSDIKTEEQSLTARFLNGMDVIPVPKEKRLWNQSLKITGAHENNLNHVDVEFPLGVLTCVTGVSGSGKSTLVKKILFPALSKTLGLGGEETGKHSTLEGDYKQISQVEFVDQNPIGKSSRSNPVTYVKAYDAIRTLMSEQEISKQRGYKPSHFSFNVEGGRCETCQGEGTTKIEMQFMADILLTCESCRGKRFKREILDIKYNDKNVAEILDLTVEDSLEFFKSKTAVYNKLKPLNDVGLGYVRLGQSSNSLSGGEAQRVKLASFLGKGKQASKEHVLFIFDEPTTGLHFHDIDRLLTAINALIDKGNSVIIIEHNQEIIKCADWVIDLGPEGGENGGNVCFTGTPEELIKEEDNHTAVFLKEKF